LCVVWQTKGSLGEKHLLLFFFFFLLLKASWDNRLWCVDQADWVVSAGWIPVSTLMTLEWLNPHPTGAALA